MAKSKTRNTSKPQAQTPPTPAPAAATPGKPVRYRLTAPFTTETGARWAKGLEVYETPEEIKRRQIPAEPAA